MATTLMSAFLFILYILQTIPQDLTPGYGNICILFFQRNVFKTAIEKILFASQKDSKIDAGGRVENFPGF